jgi:L-threonylcarbamoyladenylate synthase
MEEKITHSIQNAQAALEEGGIVVFPTETAYGIAADAGNSEAVEKVYEAKERSREKGLTVICSSVEQAKSYCELGELEKKIVEEFMPGPLTLVTEKNDDLPDNLNEQFVFRVSSSSVARSIAKDFPITATSANISGNETSYSVEDISCDLLDEVDAIVDRGELESMPTSTIAEVVDGEIVVHREGPISLSELQETVFDDSENQG